MHTQRTKLRGSISVGFLLLIAAALPAEASNRKDLLPFERLYGSPEILERQETLQVRLWSEGGRLHLRVIPDGTPHEFQGSLSATGKGILKDSVPLSRTTRIRQFKPGRIDFDGASDEKVSGFDVILAGDFQSLIFDIWIDGKQIVERVKIGSDRTPPAILPVEFGLGLADESWLDRFGF